MGLGGSVRFVDLFQPVGWMDEAFCARSGLPMDVAFPGEQDVRGQEYMLGFCEKCPVANDCLQYALDNDIGSGTWGGLTEQQRRAMKKVRAA